MVPEQNRLPSPEFHSVLKSGKKAFSASLVLKFRENKLTFSRFGFIVSTKYNKRATARNRAKRLMREVIRHNLDKIKTGYDIILNLKFSAKPDFQDIKKTVMDILEKSGLI